MSDLYWLTDEQMARLEPYFPKSHGKPRRASWWAWQPILGWRDWVSSAFLTSLRRDPIPPLSATPDLCQRR